MSIAAHTPQVFPLSPLLSSVAAPSDNNSRLQVGGEGEAVAPAEGVLPVGRLVELSGARGCGRTTLATAAVLQAQREGEPVAWVQPEGGGLYPPDLADSGVDLNALVIVHIPPTAGPHALPRAAELLLRSGGYGLVVLDFLPPAPLPPGQMAWQGRLLSMAREHHCRVVLLTPSPSHRGSLGPLISLRIEPQWQRQAPGIFALSGAVLKDKAGACGGMRELPPTQRRGPWGLL